MNTPTLPFDQWKQLIADDARLQGEREVFHYIPNNMLRKWHQEGREPRIIIIRTSSLRAA